MAFTVTSPKNTCAVTATTAIANVQNHGAGVNIYIQYTKDSETALKIELSVLNPGAHATTYFDMVHADSNYDLSTMFYTITGSDNFRIPVTLGLGETKLKLTFSSTAGDMGGSIAVDVLGGD